MARQAQALLPISIGIEAAGKRKETDSMGEMEVPANHYWGASYSDAEFPTITHHLKFCGSYAPETKSFSKCEKHNSMD